MNKDEDSGNEENDGWTLMHRGLIEKKEICALCIHSKWKSIYVDIDIDIDIQFAKIRIAISQPR